MRYVLSLILVALIGCSRDATPEPSADEDRMGIPSKGGAPIPLGEVSTPEELAAKADIPLYPGAETPEKQSNIKREAGEARYEVVMLTKDSPAKVLAFYKKKLTRGQQVGDQWMGMTPKGQFASIKAEVDQGKTKITAVVRASEK